MHNIYFIICGQITSYVFLYNIIINGISGEQLLTIGTVYKDCVKIKNVNIQIFFRFN